MCMPAMAEEVVFNNSNCEIPKLYNTGIFIGNFTVNQDMDIASIEASYYLYDYENMIIDERFLPIESFAVERELFGENLLISDNATKSFKLSKNTPYHITIYSNKTEPVIDLVAYCNDASAHNDYFNFNFSNVNTSAIKRMPKLLIKSKPCEEDSVISHPEGENWLWYKVAYGVCMDGQYGNYFIKRTGKNIIGKALIWLGGVFN